MTGAASRVPEGQPAPRFDRVERRVERCARARGPAPQLEPADRDALRRLWADGALSLDAGCGTGVSTLALARLRGGRWLGVDKSRARLAKAPRLDEGVHLRLLDHDALFAFAEREGWCFREVVALYPNPWPKPSQLGRRLYGHTSFPALRRVTSRLQVRCNWQVYAEELAHALRVCGWSVELARLPPDAPALSPFGDKYRASGHVRFEVTGTAGAASEPDQDR